MRLRARTDLWATSLFAALGLLPLAACGGKSDGDDDGGVGATTGSGASGGSVMTGTGGASTGGASTGSGGTLFPGSGGSGTGSGGTLFPGNGGNSSVNRFPCNNPLLSIDSPGYVFCDNGSTIRQTVETCPSKLPRAEPAPTYSPELGGCQYDADCTELPNGYCASGGNEFGGDQAPGTYCYYGCTTDAECGTGMICVCGDPIGHCAQATCASDADCAPGFHCADYDASGGCDIQGFACQKPADSCMVDVDCGGELCGVDYDSGARVCGGLGCAIGRPFLVDDVARVAPTTRRGDWLACGLEPELHILRPDLRDRLRAEWTRAAQLEHASVAAFSRFLMELLAFGAPSELVAETVSAIEDERQHAQICFTLASEFAGEPLGPGPLDVQGALETPTLPRSLATAVREGCIGETVAALEASELAEHVVDPMLRQVLERIAADERRHAELAWKFAHWALSQQPELAAVLASELELVREEMDAYEPLTTGPSSVELARAGVMPASLRGAVRDAALRQIVEPGLAGMISHARRSERAAA
jgi:hypothetical protein